MELNTDQMFEKRAQFRGRKLKQASYQCALESLPIENISIHD